MCKNLCLVLPLVSFLLSCSEVHPENSDLGSLQAGDFVEKLTGRQTGHRSLELVLTLANPTPHSICVYEEILGLSDVALAAHPSRVIVGTMDSPFVVGELVFGGEDHGAIDHRQSSTTMNRFRPNIEIQPGASYTFSQKRSFSGYATGYSFGSVGVQDSSAPASHYKVRIRGLQIFICGRTGFLARNTVQKKGLSFDMRRQRSIAPNKLRGIYWRFDDVAVGEGFLLSLPNAPVGVPITIHD